LKGDETRDPLDYLVDLIGKPRTIDFKNVDYPNYGGSLKTYPWETGRLWRVTEMVAEKAGWGKRKLGNGSAVGIAAHRSFLTYVASKGVINQSNFSDYPVAR
jgi:isoquinoline 1-oxidoreductase beta subunit